MRVRGSRSRGQAQSEITGFVPGNDGVELFYSVEGEGLPLVFCYGLMCSSLHWTYQIEALSSSYKTIWCDYRGHNRSGRPHPETMTIESLAADVLAVLDKLAIERACFLGHSMGVSVVLEIYRQRPDFVSHMVLANGTAQRPLEMLLGPVSSPLFRFFGAAHKRFPSLVDMVWRIQGQSALVQAIVGLWGFNTELTSREDIARYVEQVASMDPALWLKMLESYEQYDATYLLERISLPVLLIGGMLDRVMPKVKQELMHQLLPQSELVLLPHGSHCPQMDMPEQVSHLIRDFLDRHN